MKTPHKYSELICAIASGEQMQQKGCSEWIDCSAEAALNRLSLGMPTRIKPEPKPDWVYYVNCYDNCVGVFCDTKMDLPVASDALGKIKITFDGETGKLKSAEAV